MLKRGTFIRIGALAFMALTLAPVAHAQFAVIDVGAITQLVTQVQTLQAELATARDHLAQAQAEYASMTGGRNMERLVYGVQRNYLPTSWPDIEGVLQGASGGYGALSGGLRDAVTANSVLTPAQLAALPPDVHQRIDSGRHLTALSQSLARQALTATSNRFSMLQQLIDALPRATDQKAVLDLQARIGAETVMLENEQTKLQTLYQAVQAEEQANRQALQERATAGHGSFGSRFRPVP